MSEFQPMFLFGSGISPAPGVSALTDKILTADLHRNSNAGPWYRGSPQEWSSRANDPRVVRFFLELLRHQIAKSHGVPLPRVSYEDIANLCVQLDYNSDTHRNPAIAPFAGSLRAHLTVREDEFAQLPAAALDWMAWATHYEFREPGVATSDEAKKKIPALGSFARYITEKRPTSVVVTLNHDTFLEEAFEDKVQMGFGGDTRCVFAPDLLACHGPTSPMLLKLHGSIDWFFEGGRVVRHRKWPELHPDWRPVVLSGTISKLEDYNYLLFPWLWAELQNRLRKTRRLVISGYGFKDLGMNSRLTDWMNHYPDARMLVLHGHPEELLNDVSKSSLGGVSGFFRNRNIVIKDAESDQVNTQIVIASAWFQEAVAAPWQNYINSFLES